MIREEAEHELLQFLCKGTLSDVQPDWTEPMLVSRLGVPKWRHPRLLHDSHGRELEVLLLVYPGLEIVFLNGPMYSIGINFGELECDFLYRVRLEWLAELSSFTRSQFVEFVRRHGLVTRRVHFSFEDPGDGPTYEVEPTGTWMSFDGPPDERINQLRYCPSRPGRFEYENEALT